jgi:pimeloyl-ACP methyl ester carboxylesterase
MAELESQTGFAEVNGARLYYEVAGTGHPLVLIHAGIADHHMWDNQFALFARQYRVIRYDLRGLGQSAMPPGPYGLYQDLYGLLQYLGIAQAHVIGVSIGGMTAVDFTLEHPEMVTALIPVAAGVSGSKPPEDSKALFEPLDAAYEARDLDRLLELEMDLWVVGPGRTRDAIDPALRQAVETMERANLEREFAGEEGTFERLDPPATGRLGEIQAPTLVIVGDADTPNTIANAETLAAEIPGARKVVLPNVAHMVPMEAPDAFNRIVLDFLGSLPGGR